MPMTRRPADPAAAVRTLRCDPRARVGAVPIASLIVAVAMAWAGAREAHAGTTSRHEENVAPASQERSHAKAPRDDAATPAASASKPKADYSGKRRIGKASYYHRRFAGRTMADGTPMNPNDDNAASRTLPLGTKARVTNLETGRSAVVTIQDRGPYVKGRIVDLSPRSAQEIGLTRDEGVAQVEVAPIEVPLPDGRVKPGDGLRPRESRQEPG